MRNIVSGISLNFWCTSTSQSIKMARMLQPAESARVAKFKLNNRRVMLRHGVEMNALFVRKQKDDSACYDIRGTHNYKFMCHHNRCKPQQQ